jgi:hypothetical protein
MKELKRKYLKLLQLELEDLAEDLEVLLELNSRKKDSGEITNYVYLENISLLQHEIACVKDFTGHCDSAELEQAVGLADLEASLKGCLEKRARASDYPEAVSQLVVRKMKKIAGYLSGE